MWRWKKGTKPDPGHLFSLFNLAAEMGLLHILLPAVEEPESLALLLAEGDCSKVAWPRDIGSRADWSTLDAVLH